MSINEPSEFEFYDVHKRFDRISGGTAIPAWAIVLVTGISMLIVGAGIYALLKKFIVDSADANETTTYQPAMQEEI